MKAETQTEMKDDPVMEESEKYEFLKKVTTVGRPKHLGAWRLKFPKPGKIKKKKITSKKLGIVMILLKSPRQKQLVLADYSRCC